MEDFERESEEFLHLISEPGNRYNIWFSVYSCSQPLHGRDSRRHRFFQFCVAQLLQGILVVTPWVQFQHYLYTNTPFKMIIHVAPFDRMRNPASSIIREEQCGKRMNCTFVFGLPRTGSTGDKTYPATSRDTTPCLWRKNQINNSIRSSVAQNRLYKFKHIFSTEFPTDIIHPRNGIWIIILMRAKIIRNINYQSILEPCLFIGISY